MVLKKEKNFTSRFNFEENIKLNDDFKNIVMKINFVPTKSLFSKNRDQFDLATNIDEIEVERQ